MESPLVSVVVPAYNEERTIGQLLRRAAACPLRTEIVVVDDGSTDGTAAAIAAVQEKMPGLVVAGLDRDRGKGAAVRRGIAMTAGDIGCHPGRRPRVRPR